MLAILAFFPRLQTRLFWISTLCPGALYCSGMCACSGWMPLGLRLPSLRGRCCTGAPQHRLPCCEIHPLPTPFTASAQPHSLHPAAACSWAVTASRASQGWS